MRCGAARWPSPSFLRSAGRLCPRSARGLGLIRNSLAGINARLSHRSRHQPINICCAVLKVARGGGDPAVESARLSRRLAGSARHLPSRPSSSTRHFPSRPASSARHFPSRPAGSTCGLARSCLSRRHSFSPILFDVAKLPFQGAFIDNASLFADFVVAHGESITFSGRHAVVPSKYLEVVITKYS